MPETSEQTAWLNSVFGLQLQGDDDDDDDDDLAIPAAPPARDDPEWTNLREILLIILLKIPAYAENDEQEAQWLTRANEAMVLWQQRDAATADKINALGKEMMEAAKRKAAAAAPLKQWHKAFQACRSQADALKAALVGQLQAAGDDTQVAGFEKGWAMFEQELQAVDAVIEDGFEEAQKAGSGKRAAVMAKAGNAARAEISGSALLKGIDGSAEHPTTIVKDLEDAIAAFSKSVKADA